MAWQDRTAFKVMNFQFELREKEVIRLMRSNLKNLPLKHGEKEFLIGS